MSNVDPILALILGMLGVKTLGQNASFTDKHVGAQRRTVIYPRPES